MEVESEWVSKKRERASPNQAKKRLEWATRPRFGVVGFNPIDQAEFPAPSGYPAALYWARCNEYANGMTVPDSIETSTLTQLRQAATEAAQHAYSPYSSFRVGAALLLDNGDIVSGCNVENASFGLTICAERSAMVQAVTRFGPKVRVQAVVVTNLNRAASSPCGACRQFLAEFASADTPVFFPDAAGETMQTIAALLPFGFSSDSL